MTDVRAAKRALARLVDPCPVADAERALRNLDRAAEFREAGGLVCLQQIADRANPADSRATRARAVLAAFDRFDRAVSGAPLDDDHFRRGRDTPLPDGS